MNKSCSALENFVNNKKAMLGGGYTVNPEDQIAGMATYNGYDDVEIHSGLNPNEAVAPVKNLIGGAKKTKKTTKKSKSGKKSKNGSKTNTSGSKTKKNKRKGSKKSMSKGAAKKGGRMMKGGQGCGMKSVGDNYPFNGELSNHNPDMATKDFAGKQPEWGASTR